MPRPAGGGSYWIFKYCNWCILSILSVMLTTDLVIDEINNGGMLKLCKFYLCELYTPWVASSKLIDYF